MIRLTDEKHVRGQADKCQAPSNFKMANKEDKKYFYISWFNFI